MEDIKEAELIVVTPKEKLEKELSTISTEILGEQNPDKIKDLTKLFNLNIQKKNILRLLKLNNLLDIVDNKIVERFEKKPDEITNKELVDFMSAVQGSIEKTNKSLDNIGDVPIIQLNQQNNSVNINIQDSLGRESKNKVIDVISAILKAAQTPQEQSCDADLTDDSNVADNNIDDIEEEELVLIETKKG